MRRSKITQTRLCAHSCPPGAQGGRGRDLEQSVLDLQHIRALPARAQVPQQPVSSISFVFPDQVFYHNANCAPNILMWIFQMSREREYLLLFDKENKLHGRYLSISIYLPQQPHNYVNSQYTRGGKEKLKFILQLKPVRMSAWCQLKTKCN